jgi:N-acetylglucosaminyldiphosphoundecaprenol N-acetyl-beta-D-mannosaminyltransferase
MNAFASTLTARPKAVAPTPAPLVTREKSRPQKSPIAMLGVPFDNVTTEEAIRLIDEMIASRQPHYLATANVDFTVQALHDPELRKILAEAHLVVCDGMPLVWASKWLRNPLPERVAGADLVPALLKVAAARGYRVYFLGGKAEVAQQAVANVREQYPTLQVAGVWSPPFAPLASMDHADICRRVRESKADLLFVSFGCPKQEKWIAMNYQNCGVPVSVGVGATIDFLAGSMRRAPRWMQATGLEWIFRLLQEPRRLFRRYAGDLVVFGYGILRQTLRLRGQRPHNTSTTLSETSPHLKVAAKVVQLPERFDAIEVRDHETTWQQLMEEPNDLLVDASKVAFIDSTGVGMLIRLRKQLRERNHELVLNNPTAAMRRALEIMKLDGLFVLTTSPTLNPAS